MPPVTSVRVEPQPYCWALTIANTSTTRPAVTEKAPARSNDLRSDDPRDSGTKRMAAAKAASPIGRLTMNTQRHDNRSVRMPPSSSPTAAPPAAMPLHTLSAFVRSSCSVKVVVMIDSAAGDTSAPPRPCRARPRMSTCELCASALSAEATANSVTPIMNRRRRPSRSAARPPSSRKPPNSRV